MGENSSLTRFSEPAAIYYEGYSIPPEVISYAVWLYFDFHRTYAWLKKCLLHAAVHALSV